MDSCNKYGGTMIKIDKNIELKSVKFKFGPLPFADLNIGDSFLIPGLKSTAQISSTVQAHKFKTGFTFTSRRCPEGVRIWRVK